MTKKEQELQGRLLDVLEANTRALGGVYDLLVSVSGAASKGCSKPQKTEAPVKEEVPQKEAVSEEVPQKEATDSIDIEYVRKAMKAIMTKVTPAEAKELLATFDGATTVPKLKKKHYPAFIEAATKIMTEGK